MTAPRPRLGFLGTGWIGRNRLAGIAASGLAEIVAIFDPSPDSAQEALALAPGAAILSSPESLLDAGLDGLVIATPSALHADQAIAALERGTAVFCQKPLGRNAPETRRVVEAARAADRLLAVDFSYRHTIAARTLAAIMESGALGEIFAADLTFHNAYGPDKAWFHDRVQSGGGCVIDLGVHLVDLALWLTGFPAVERVTARTFAKGRPLGDNRQAVEDYAIAQLDLSNGATVRLACSWNVDAGQDALIAATFQGTRGGATFRNVGGSFYDFELLRLSGTAAERIVAPPDDWGARAAVAWVRQLADHPGFDPEAGRAAEVAVVIDRIYAAASLAAAPGRFAEDGPGELSPADLCECPKPSAASACPGQSQEEQPMAEAVNTDETSELIASNKVEGTSVFDVEGERLGSIMNFMVDKRSGTAEYAVMQFGGFLGIGADYYPIPWSMLTYSTDHGGYVVDLDKDMLEDAPRYSDESNEPAYDQGYNEQVYSYYGVTY